MWTFIALALGFSFLLSLTANGFVRAWSRRRGYLDKPGGHKQHAQAVALGGGVAITFSICAPILAALATALIWSNGDVPGWVPKSLQLHLPGVASRTGAVLGVIGGAIVLHVLGLIDDARHLGPVVKLAVQIAVAAVMAIVFEIRILELEILPGWVPTILTIGWIVLITNAFNFLDNMDGLSAGVAAIVAAIFAAAALRNGQLFVPAAMLILVGTLAGYLVFNFPPASLFMGDAGSLPIGFLMSVLIVLTVFYDPTQHATPAGVLLPIVVLAVPLYDVGSVVVLRLRAGVSPFRGDRRHFSHRLVQRGFSTRTAVLTIYLATLATSLGAILLPTLDWPAAITVFIQTLAVVGMIAILEYT